MYLLKKLAMQRYTKEKLQISVTSDDNLKL